MSHQDFHKNLSFGNVKEENIVDCIHNWRTNPFLQTIRLWGFENLSNTILEQDPSVKRTFSDRACDQCVQLAQRSDLLEKAKSISGDFYNVIRVASALSKYFSEPWMDQVVKDKSKIMLQEGDYK